MQFFFNHLYFFGSLVGFLVTIALFFYRKDLRSKMLCVGAVVGILGFFLEYFFFIDYWNPPLLFELSPFGGIEDLMFGFAAGAFGSSLYDLLDPGISIQSPNKARLVSIVTLMISVQVGSILLLTNFLGINSIYSSSIGLALIGVGIVIRRPDLLKRALFTSVVGSLLLISAEYTFLTFYPEYLNNYFLLSHQVPYILRLVPITELIWGLCFFFMVGTLYVYAFEKETATKQTSIIS